MKIYSFSPFGYEGSLVSVEVDLRRGIPAVDLVGLADGAVKESRERMRSAIRNSGLDFPPERVLISLSPADLKKEGAGFDLAIALAVLDAKKRLDKAEEDFPDGLPLDSDIQGPVSIPGKDECGILVMGELELNGKVRPVRGIHAAASTAISGGITMCIVPVGNCEEARDVPGMKVFGAENLCEAFEALGSPESFTKRKDESIDVGRNVPEVSVEIGGILFPPKEDGFDFSQISGQDFLLRGLQIAAAGGHNLMAYGPPGCGKTLTLQHYPNLVPLLSVEEAQPVTRIYSIAGLLPPGQPLRRKPPFRQPHQTASVEGMCGGGIHCSPGEISLAHNGTLFLDEASEFKSSVLQMLRVPLESGAITLSRAGRSTVYPANFQLLMATNPCPCGFFGSKEKVCLCSARSIEQYWKKFSGPLLDRIDIMVQVDSSTRGENEIKTKSTDELREGIARAVKIQRQRQGKKNSNLSPSEIAEYCRTSDRARDILEKSANRYQLSPRAISGCLKLGRTIADMAEKEIIDGESMSIAVEYRKNQAGMNLGGW